MQQKRKGQCAQLKMGSERWNECSVRAGRQPATHVSLCEALERAAVGREMLARVVLIAAPPCAVAGAGTRVGGQNVVLISKSEMIPVVQARLHFDRE